MAQKSLNRVFNSVLTTITVSNTTKVLVNTDSGALILATGAGASTVTLPAVEDGLHFKFFAGSAQAHVLKAATAVIQGFVYDNTNGTTLARTAIADKLSITLVNPAIGDVMNVWSDGTNWYVDGILNQTPTLGT
tara:strand:+ start:48 stop:449 length:402 start_codon:yes stop_codon:yes gene_type:complete